MVLAALLLTPLLAGAASIYGKDYPLVDEQGQVTALSSFRGHNLVLAMEYANCRFMCTSTFSKLKEIQQAADAGAIPLEIVVISLDPLRDTPAEWRAYRKMRGLNGNRWHLMSPRLEDMPKIASLLGINYWYAGEHLLHDFRLLKIAPQGEVVGTMTLFDGDASRFLR